MNAAGLETAIPLHPKQQTGQQITLKQRNALILKNQGLVRKVAHKYASKCKESFEELVQEGNLGLIKAIERYEDNRGAAFSSFAVPYIRGAILHFLRDRSHSVKVPRAWQETYQRVRRAERAGRDEAQIVQQMDITDTWGSIKQAMQGWTLALDEEICETIVDSYAPWQYAEAEELVETLSALEPATRSCVEAVYFQQMSKRQAAKKLKIAYKQVEANVEQAVDVLAAKFSERKVLLPVQEKAAGFIDRLRAVQPLLSEDVTDSVE